MKTNYLVKIFLFLLISNIKGLKKNDIESINIENLEDYGAPDFYVNNETLDTFSNQPSYQNYDTQEQIEMSGEVATQRNTEIITGQNELLVLPSYFSQMIGLIGDRNSQIKMLYSATERDKNSGELKRKFMMEVLNFDGSISYLGGIEYPMRDMDEEIIPRFMQSKNSNEIMRFLNLDQEDVNEQEFQAKEFNDFERGEVSGSMCGQCNLKTEIISEDEQVKRFTIRLEVLNSRMSQIMDKVKSSNPDDRLEALNELRQLKSEISGLEQQKLERELEIEMIKEREIRQREAAIRDRLEQEIWGRIRELERQKLEDWEAKGGLAGEQLSQLEKMWFNEMDKNRNAEKDFFLVNQKIEELEKELENIQKNTMALENQDDQGEDVIDDLNARLAEESAKKDKLLEMNEMHKNLISGLEKDIEFEKNNRKKAEDEEREIRLKLEKLEKEKAAEQNWNFDLSFANQEKLKELKKLQKIKENEVDRRKGLELDLNAKEKELDLLQQARNIETQKGKDALMLLTEKDSQVNNLLDELESIQKERNNTEGMVQSKIKEIESLLPMLESVKSQTGSKQQEVVDLRKELGNIQKQIDFENKEKSSIDAQLGDLTKMIKALSSQMENEIDSKNNLLNQVDDKFKEIEMLKKQIAAQNSLAQKANSDLQTLINLEKQVVMDLDNQAKENQAILMQEQAIQNTINGVTSQLKDQRKQLLDAEARVLSAQAKFDVLDKEQSDIKQMIDSGLKIQKDLNSQLVNLENQKKRDEANLMGVNSQNAELEERISQIYNDLKSLDDENKEQNEKYANLENEKKFLTIDLDKFGKEVADLKKNVTDLDNENAALHKELLDLLKQKDNLTELLKSLRLNKAELEQKVGIEQGQVNLLNQEIMKLNAEAMQFENELNEKQKEIDEISKREQDLIQFINQMKEQSKDANLSLKLFSDRINGLNAQIRPLENSLKNLVNEGNALELDLNNKLGRIENLEKEIEQEQMNLAIINGQEKDTMHKIKTLEKILDINRQKLNSAFADRDNVLGKISELERQNTDMTKEKQKLIDMTKNLEMQWKENQRQLQMERVLKQKYESEKDDWADKLDDLQAALDQESSIRKEIESKSSMMFGEIEKLRNSIDNTKDAKDQTQDQYSALQKTLRDLRETEKNQMLQEQALREQTRRLQDELDAIKRQGDSHNKRVADEKRKQQNLQYEIDLQNNANNVAIPARENLNNNDFQINIDLTPKQDNLRYNVTRPTTRQNFTTSPSLLLQNKPRSSRPETDFEDSGVFLSSNETNDRLNLINGLNGNSGIGNFLIGSSKPNAEKKVVKPKTRNFSFGNLNKKPTSALRSRLKNKITPSTQLRNKRPVLRRNSLRFNAQNRNKSRF